MAKISLRQYNREIENFINSGRIDEAIAHCLYILKLFPKCIDSYRLLGKAYLESQRYSEAADILTRILSVIPDDFVSQIGMSIIREDEGNLDAAIYHMERAFEVKPSNSAVQDELRRLYGRRDGIEPPRVRLTRGALVRMYARGELYTQAIAEIRAALVEDSKRVDLEVILARIYLNLGRKVESTEVCSRLVNKLPDCLEANRILSEILPGTSRATDADSYRLRVASLDPYFAYITPQAPTSAEVPDNAISLDFLEFQPSPKTSQQPDWARSIGIEIQNPPDTAPEWLMEAPNKTSTVDLNRDQSAIGSDTSTRETAAFVENQAGEPVTDSEIVQDPEIKKPEDNDASIPEWMRSAGWSETTETSNNENTSQTQIDDSSDGLAEADIPDWLRAIAPVQETVEKPQTKSELENLAILDQILESHPTSTIEDKDQVMVEPKEQQAIISAPESEEMSPSGSFTDWMKDNTQEEQPSNAPPEQSSTIPDWLIGEEAPAEANLSKKEPSITEVPVWMMENESNLSSPSIEPAEEEGKPDWMKNLEVSSATAIESGNNSQITPALISDEDLSVAKEETQHLEENALDDMDVEQPTAENISPILEPDSGWTSQPEETTTITEEPAIANELTPDWLLGIQSDTPQDIVSGSEKTTDEWLKSFEPDSSTEPEIVQNTQDTIPDWLKELESSNTPESNLTDLNSLAPFPESFSATTDETQPVAVRRIPAPPPQDTDIITGISEIGPEKDLPEKEVSSSLDWLESLTSPDESVAPAETISTPEAVLGFPADEIPQITPDSEAESQISPVIGEIEGQPGRPEDSAAAGISPESAVIPPLPPVEANLPEITDTNAKPLEVPSVGISEIVETTPEFLTSPVTGSTESSSADMDLDAAFAWLESLAVRQGVEEGTLLVSAKDRAETPPEWVQHEKEKEADSQTVVKADLLDERLPPVPTSSEAFSIIPHDLESDITQGEAIPPLPEQHETSDQTSENLPDIFVAIEQPSVQESMPVEPQEEMKGLEGLVPSEPENLSSMDATEAESAVLQQPEPGIMEEPLPDWLKGMDLSSPFEPNTTDSVSNWLKDSELPASEAMPTAQPNSFEEPALEPLPDWLIGLTEVQPSQLQAEPVSHPENGELPAWLQDSGSNEPEKVPHPESDLPVWIPDSNIEELPASNEQVLEKPVLEEVPGENITVTQTSEEEIMATGIDVETGMSRLVTEEPGPEAAVLQEILPPVSETLPNEILTSDLEMVNIQKAARFSLDKGSIDSALEKYTQWVKSEKQLDVAIQDLQGALYRYPVYIPIYMVLGDALARSNRLQDALDTYTKAEELLLK